MGFERAVGGVALGSLGPLERSWALEELVRRLWAEPREGEVVRLSSL